MLMSEKKSNLGREIREIRVYTYQVLSNLLFFDGDWHMKPLRSLKKKPQKNSLKTKMKWLSNLKKVKIALRDA